MKKAVMYGAGNIGRGFIGALMSQSGYEVTFVDVAPDVVTALQEKNTYPLRYVACDGYEDVWVRNVTAVNGNDTDAVSEVIADCQIMATAVGVRILKFIAPNIVAGLRKRWARTDAPLNIIICENLVGADKLLEGLLKEQLTAEECAHFDKTVGLVVASIGRMVPVQTETMKDGEPLRVCVERYGILPVDKAAFRGEIPAINNMIPYEPFDYYHKRKLYVHNLGHSMCAYLGDLLGLEYIYQVIAVPQIRTLVQNAMQESALALSKKYEADYSELLEHIADLLFRFGNAALGDTCRRVGGDPARKLGPDDRLIGAAKTALQMGVDPVYISIGAAAGVKRYIAESEDLEQSLDSAKTVLLQICELPADGQLAQRILRSYQQLLNGATLDDMLTFAQA